jgi:AcrR family transcriptional regulator
VLQAADAVFLDRGFVAASVDEIAEHAGYSKGAVYASFPNKAALFLAVSTEHLRVDALELFDQIGEVEQGDDIPAVMAAWFQDKFGSDTRRVLMEAEFWLVTARDAGERQAGSDFLDLSRRTVESLIREQAGRLGIELPLDPATIATATIALRHGLALQAWFDNGGNEASVFAASTAALLGVSVASPTHTSQPARSHRPSGSSSSARSGSTRRAPG